MSANKITLKIDEDARAQAGEIIAAAREKASASAAAIAKQAAAKAAEVEKDTAAQCQECQRRATLIFQMDSRKNLLSAKRAVIDQAYELAAQKLRELGENDWKALIGSIVENGAETGREKLRVPAKDRGRYTPAFLGELNARLEKRGLPGLLALDGENAPFDEGVALVSDISELNGSFEAVLKDARQATEKEVATLLFTEVG